MDLSPTKNPRPFSISLVCLVSSFEFLILILICVVNAMGLLPTIEEFPFWFEWFLGLCGITGLASMFAIWNMKKVGVYAYVALRALAQIVFLAVGNWAPMSLILPGLVIVFLTKHFKRMT